MPEASLLERCIPPPLLGLPGMAKGEEEGGVSPAPAPLCMRLVCQAADAGAPRLLAAFGRWFIKLEEWFGLAQEEGMAVPLLSAHVELCVLLLSWGMTGNALVLPLALR